MPLLHLVTVNNNATVIIFRWESNKRPNEIIITYNAKVNKFDFIANFYHSRYPILILYTLKEVDEYPNDFPKICKLTIHLFLKIP